MEDTRPYESIEFVVRIIYTLAIDEEVEIKVSSNGVHVVINVFNLLEFPKNVNIFHLVISHFVKLFYQVFSQPKSKFVFRKISKSLINQPNMHICDGVIDVEIVRNVHGVYEFPRINVH